jgi:KUP system potassium uptake protein
VLAFTALGVVYGDIGTSPLYAVQDAFKPVYGLQADAARLFGLLSLIVWSLVLIVTAKYVGFILRADNKGEGGVYALLALILRSERKAGRSGRTALIMLGLFGGAFLYGDGIITPAISVVGAIEGLKVLNEGFEHLVVPVTFVIIATLFYFQYHGTARIGRLFGWIMLAWFTSIAALGVRGILLHPEIFAAINPLYAIRFFTGDPVRSFVVLGAVVLVVTGGEALYADMGHFGRKPIRVAWLALVLPSLLINYFGQGALILSDPAAAENPFYLLAPSWWLVPQIIISTLAAIVASQALISGAFSLTQQAVQLGYSPRVTIVHTSKQEAGQIYIPEINAALAAGTLLLVVTAGSVEKLGQMYGVAVTATMVITNLLFVSVARERFNWSRGKCIAFLAVFLVLDLTFFLANLLKVPTGGWVPLAVAGAVFALMTTWKRGRELLRQFMTRSSLPVTDFVQSLRSGKVVRVPGTAIFMTSESEGTPVVLLHHLKHNKVLHEQVVVMTIRFEEIPYVPEDQRFEVTTLPKNFYRLLVCYGFMEEPNIPDALRRAERKGLHCDPMQSSYFLSRETVIPSSKPGMSMWREHIFAWMSRSATSAMDFFNIPPNRVVELGTQIEI